MFPAKELFFELEDTGWSEELLTVWNTHDKPVAVKFKLTNARHYRVRPSQSVND